MRPVLARVSLQPFRRQRPHGAAGLIALVGALTVLGCDRAGPPSTPTATVASEPVPEATAQVPAIATLRFASLSPAMTQMLVDLGLGDRIVGRTPFCDSVPESVPIVGSLLDVDYERLIEVAPTHIVVQPAASGTDPEVERLAQDHHWVLIEQGLDRLADVDAFLSGFAANLHLPPSPALADLTARCEEKARAIRALGVAPTSRASKPIRTLLLVGNDPPTAAGSDTFVSEMIVAAGGANAITATGYPELSLEDIVALNPEAICVLREIAPTEEERAALVRTLVTGATDAARARRVEVFVSPFVMLPSTRAPLVVAELRAMLDRWAPTAGAGGR